MVLLPVHSQNYSQIRKKCFKYACKKVAVNQRPISYRGQHLIPTIIRRIGNCPPPDRTKVTSAPQARAGRATQALRVLSWNAGHLGQQQWSEVKSWLSTEASQTCDAGTAFRLHLQTTHSRPKKKTKKGRGGTARPVKEAEARPESSQDQTPSGPSVARADGVMVLMSPRIAAKRPVARTCRRPGLGSPLRLAGRSGHAL